MIPSAWHPDEHGTYTITLPEGPNVWINGRRPYCDRGHWEWGFTGPSPVNVRESITPSYYFMTLAHALKEIEAWLDRGRGFIPDPGVLEARPFVHGVGLSEGWVEQGHGLRAQANVEGEPPVVLTLNPITLKEGQGFILNVEGIESLDDSDRFPRLYAHAEVAQSEAEAFLAWRLLKEPSEIPGPITLPPRPFPIAAVARPRPGRM